MTDTFGISRHSSWARQKLKHLFKPNKLYLSSFIQPGSCKEDLVLK